MKHLVLATSVDDRSDLIRKIWFRVSCAHLLPTDDLALFFISFRYQAHNEGFLVEEDGNLQIRRVLLSEVTAEATYAFLRYLYSADSNIRPHVLSDVRILAARFVYCILTTDPTLDLFGVQILVFAARFLQL